MLISSQKFFVQSSSGEDIGPHTIDVTKQTLDGKQMAHQENTLCEHNEEKENYLQLTHLPHSTTAIFKTMKVI